jgi:GTP pyrophosphokinase
MVSSLKFPVFKKEAQKKDSLKIRGLIDGMAVHFAGCCHPLPGDRIVGIVTTGKGVTVHTLECPSLKNYEKEPERWLDIDWGTDAENEKHTARLKLMLSNEPGALADVANIVAKTESNIMNLNITYRTLSYFEILLDIEVKNVAQLNTLITALKASKSISYVARATK